MNGEKQSRKDLLRLINEVSFAAYDTLLFLDTHPNDQQALNYYREVSAKRKEALAEYGQMYGPLTMDCGHITDGNRWQLIDQPWPWEGGGC